MGSREDRILNDIIGALDKECDDVNTTIYKDGTIPATTHNADDADEWEAFNQAFVLIDRLRKLDKEGRWRVVEWLKHKAAALSEKEI